MTTPIERGDEEPFACPNCGTESRGEFCQGCGQARVREGDLGLGHFWRHVASEVLDVDGRIFTTVKLLFTRPGQLTLDFLDGRRVRYIHPVRLFLVFAAGFFLLHSSTVSFTAVEARSSVSGVEARLQARAAREGVPYETLVQATNDRLALVFKVAMTGSVVLSGFWLWALFRRQRPFLGQHMVTALHLACVAMTLQVVAQWTIRVVPDVWQMPRWIRDAAIFVTVGYLERALRRLYGTEQATLHAMLLSLVMWLLVPELALRVALRWMAG